MRDQRDELEKSFRLMNFIVWTMYITSHESEKFQHLIEFIPVTLRC